MNPINHVAIIMDGNGRWGLENKNSRNAGHKAGLNTVEKIIKVTIKNKIKFLQINKILLKILNTKKYSNLIMKKPKKISDIINLSKEVRLKTRKLCIK